MESLYLLIPLSIVLVLGIGALLAWSVMSGQFEDLDAEGRRILEEPPDEPASERAAEQGRGTSGPPPSSPASQRRPDAAR